MLVILGNAISDVKENLAWDEKCNISRNLLRKRNKGNILFE